MADVRITSDLNRLRDYLSGTSRTFNTKLAVALRRPAGFVLAHMVKVHLSGPRTSKEGASVATLARGTGDLASAIKIKYVDLAHNPTALIGPGRRIKYAGLQEFGGVVRAKGKLLTIPLLASLQGAGRKRGAKRVARFSAHELKDDPGKGGFTRTFIRKSKAGNLIIFGEKGDKGSESIVPLFLLKDRVRVPARSYLSSTLKETESKVREMLQEEVGRILNEG